MIGTSKAVDLVRNLCDRLELSDEVLESAVGFARRAEFEHPINRSPAVVAAGAVYLAGLLENEKRTQTEVAADSMALEASDCTSFKHVCHRCQGATLWNPVAVLTGLLESDRGE